MLVGVTCCVQGIGAGVLMRESAVDIHLVDGTYELFRHHYGAPSALDRRGRQVGAVRGVLGSLLGLLERGATHVAVATDHVIESFRNDLWPRYKTGEGIDPELRSQFPLLEEALDAMGLPVWPMVEWEADDALASGARQAARDPRVGRVYICSPDKDLAQCVVGDRVVQLDRRKGEVRDAAGVVAKFGVPPSSIPDYLALVGDSADGFPGIPGWGAKSTAAVLARYRHLERIPVSGHDWDVAVRGKARLARALDENRESARLFRDLATLRDVGALFADVGELEWTGAGTSFTEVAAALGLHGLESRARELARARS